MNFGDFYRTCTIFAQKLENISQTCIGLAQLWTESDTCTYIRGLPEEYQRLAQNFFARATVD